MTTQVLTIDEVTLLAPAGNFISVDSLTQLIRDVEAAVLRKVAAEEKTMFALTNIDCMVLEAGLSDGKRPPFPFRARLLSAQMNANGSVKQARFRYGNHEISLEWPTIVLGMDAKP